MFTHLPWISHGFVWIGGIRWSGGGLGWNEMIFYCLDNLKSDEAFWNWAEWISFHSIIYHNTPSLIHSSYEAFLVEWTTCFVCVFSIQLCFNKIWWNILGLGGMNSLLFALLHASYDIQTSLNGFVRVFSIQFCLNKTTWYIFPKILPNDV